MPSARHLVEAVSWRVVKPNTPVAPNEGIEKLPLPLRFLAVSRRSQALAVAHPELDCLDARPQTDSIFVSTGALLTEVAPTDTLHPCSPLVAFVPTFGREA